MDKSFEKIGFGGGCHWCTEAIFQFLKGVETVQQGWIASDGNNTSPSEAVIVAFSPLIIGLQTLIAIHLHTHSCTVAHSMRSKYRSAVYIFNEQQAIKSRITIENLQPQFNGSIITQVIPFISFKPNQQNFLNYYYSDPARPFCENYITPKLRRLLECFSENINTQKLAVLAHA